MAQGDKNTKFFHNMANMRRRINHIGRLRRGGSVIDSREDIKEETATFFEKLYKRESFLRPKLEGESLPSISSEAQRLLERDFQLEEVKTALTECDSDKAPCPDGCNFAFLKTGWDFLKKDLMEMFKELHVRGRLSKAINATFLTLIPKVHNPVELRDYCLVSLLGCVYKPLSKVLMNHSKNVPPSIISPCQGAFVGKRQILDGILVANELIDFRKRMKKEGPILKIDLEKACDHVDWIFRTTC